MVPEMTLFDLVAAVAEHARSEAEVVATVVYMVNSGVVRLDGNYRDALFDLVADRAGTPDDAAA